MLKLSRYLFILMVLCFHVLKAHGEGISDLSFGSSDRYFEASNKTNFNIKFYFITEHKLCNDDSVSLQGAIGHSLPAHRYVSFEDFTLGCVYDDSINDEQEIMVLIEEIDTNELFSVYLNEDFIYTYEPEDQAAPEVKLIIRLTKNENFILTVDSKIIKQPDERKSSWLKDFRKLFVN